MRLNWVELDRFRNLQRQRIRLHPRFNLLIGPNGQGKTNFLEAVAFLGSLRSFRTAGKNDLIRHGESMCRVSGELATKELEKILSFSLNHRGRSQFLDDRRITSPEEYLRSIGTIHFIPEDVGLVGGSPSWRRKVVDRSVFETHSGYAAQYRRFLAALRQRNALLRKERALPEERESWSRALAETGSWVVKRRWDLLLALNPEVSALGEKLGLGEGLHLKYIPSFEADAGRTQAFMEDLPVLSGAMTEEGRKAAAERIMEGLREVREKEKRTRHTLVGPHRDDVLFFTGQGAAALDLARYGSRGQKRSAVLAFKLALAKVVAGVRGEWPLVILDDVSSELDDRRKGALSRIVREMEAQVFISATGEEEVLFPTGQGLVWRVDAGDISPAS